jgi:hypothetical protein
MFGRRVMIQRLRQRVGSLLLDRPRFAGLLPGKNSLRREPSNWVRFHNRGERLIPAPNGSGVDCDWRWTSDLNICRLFPSVGRRLLTAALNEWPIRMLDQPPKPESDPQISFIIGHRGAEKIPHLLATLRSLFGQEGCLLEIVVVEQAEEGLLPGVLPDGVRYILTRPPVRQLPYSRAWAFNVGARHARGRVLVFHDNDLLAPSRYGSELVARIARGVQAARLQRFVFYLSEAATERACAGQAWNTVVPQRVQQNSDGGTLAVERNAYFKIGGHDEAFIGWGGEDNEMFDRCRALACDPFGFLPFVHLHHLSQPRQPDPQGFMRRLQDRLAIPRSVRIAELSSRPLGQEAGPWNLQAKRDD